MAHVFRAVQQAVIAAIQADDFSFPLPDLIDYSWTQGIPNVSTMSYAEWERLAFLGDATASGCIANQLKHLMPEGTPHLYTVLRSGLQSNQTFAHIFRKACLLAVCSSEPVVVQPSLFKRGGDFFEAILGLMMTQKSLEFVKGWLEPMYAPLIRAAARAYLAFQEDLLRLPSPPGGNFDKTVARRRPKPKTAKEMFAIQNYLASAPVRVLRPPSQATSAHPASDATQSALATRDPNVHRSPASSYTRQLPASQVQKACAYPRNIHNPVQGPRAQIEVIDLCDDSDLSDMDISSSSKPDLSDMPVSSETSPFAPRTLTRPRASSSASIMSCDPSEWTPPTRERRARAPSPPPLLRGRSPTRCTIASQPIPRTQAPPPKRDVLPRGTVSFIHGPSLEDPFARLPAKPCFLPQVTTSSHNDVFQPPSAWPPPAFPAVPLERRLRSPSLPPRPSEYYREEPPISFYRSRYSDGNVPQRARAPSPPPRYEQWYAPLPLERRIRTPSPRRYEYPPRHDVYAHPPAPSPVDLEPGRRLPLARRLRTPSPPPSWRAYEPREQSPRVQQHSRYRYGYDDPSVGPGPAHSPTRVYY